MNNVYIKILTFLVLTMVSVNAQTIAYKCVDTEDSKYWNYFNIDYNSLHFKEGKRTNTFYYKKTSKNGDIKKYMFSNNQFTFTAIKKRNDFKNIYITDGRYSYNCKLESIMKDFTNKTPIILE